MKQAADYIRRLPKAEHETPHWQAATEALIMAAEDQGPLMFAEIGMRCALNWEKPKPERKMRARKYRIIK